MIEKQKQEAIAKERQAEKLFHISFIVGPAMDIFGLSVWFVLQSKFSQELH